MLENSRITRQAPVAEFLEDYLSGLRWVDGALNMR